MLRRGWFVAAATAAACTAMMSVFLDDAMAKGGGHGFRFGGHFARSRFPLSYGVLGYDPYFYGPPAPGVAPAYYENGSGHAAPAPPPLALTCRHSQQIVTVPTADGLGTQQVKITRC